MPSRKTYELQHVHLSTAAGCTSSLFLFAAHKNSARAASLWTTTHSRAPARPPMQSWVGLVRAWGPPRWSSGASSSSTSCSTRKFDASFCLSDDACKWAANSCWKDDTCTVHLYTSLLHALPQQSVKRGSYGTLKDPLARHGCPRVSGKCDVGTIR